VHLGSEEQSRGIEQIGKAIAQMEQVTQKAAASAEESAAAGQELSVQSGSLKEIVARLNNLIGVDASIRSSDSLRPRLTVSSKPPADTQPASVSVSQAVAKPPAKASVTPVVVPAGNQDDVFPMDSNFTEF
jgi:methyl-accepting chemotaxis protein/methyl-accepting chemotaxis protein-1 (serine sensor receptor)